MTKKIKDLNEDGVDETASAETLATHSTNVTRSDVMAMAMDHISKLPGEDLSKWFHDAIASSQHLSAPTSGFSGKNKSSIDMHSSHASAHQPAVPSIQAVKEDLEVIMKDQDLPKEFVDQAVILFESAVNARVALEAAKIQEAAEALAEEQVEALVEKIDGYLDYAAEEFFKENELAIESSLRLSMYDNFVEGLHGLFQEHFITVPEGKVEVLEAMGERIQELEAALNERTEHLLSLQDALAAESAKVVFEEAIKGLSSEDVEKFKTLSETVEFDGDQEALAAKLKIIREAHFTEGKPKKVGRTLDMTTGDTEVTLVEAEGDAKGVKELVEAAGPDMAPYVATMSRLSGFRK